MTVITMSRQIGSGADEIADRLCADLGLVAFDKRLMVRVATEAGLGEGEIVDYSEDQYKQRGFFDNLFRRQRPVAGITAWTGGRTGGYERQTRILDEEGAIRLIRATMSTAYERGNILILGRGGQAILEGRPDAFHVRIVAPFEERIKYLQGQESLQDQQGTTAAQARSLITKRDRATAEYLSTFHNIDVDDPALYHMVLNAAKLGTEKCVALIKMGVEALSIEAEAPTGS